VEVVVICTLRGKITCHEKPDNENEFHVSLGKKLILNAGDKGISVFHHDDSIDFK
jgi:hypothetical protein